MSLDFANLPRIRALMREHAIQMTGAPSTGMEIAGMIRVLANIYENNHYRVISADGTEISGPRMGILLRLTGEESRGNQQGITPSEFSRNQNVSRNTISALLRGLEEQGLIERRLDGQDRRVFRIGLTQNGRDLVSQAGPGMIHAANHMVSGLNQSEQEELLNLLTKLFLSHQQEWGCQTISSQKKE